MIGSFGSAKSYSGPAFKLDVQRDPNEPLPSTEVVRYGKRDEIHHTFTSGPKSPPVVVSLVFATAVLATLPALAAVVSYAKIPVLFAGLAFLLVTD